MEERYMWISVSWIEIEMQHWISRSYGYLKVWSKSLKVWDTDISLYFKCSLSEIVPFLFPWVCSCMERWRDLEPAWEKMQSLGPFQSRQTRTQAHLLGKSETLMVRHHLLGTRQSHFLQKSKFLTLSMIFTFLWLSPIKLIWSYLQNWGLTDRHKDRHMDGQTQFDYNPYFTHTKTKFI